MVREVHGRRLAAALAEVRDSLGEVTKRDGDFVGRRQQLLLDLVVQEREELHETVRSWQQRTTIIVAVLLAVVPFWASADRGAMKVLTAVVLVAGFAASVLALWPVKYFFPSTTAIAQNAEAYRTVSDLGLQQVLLVDSVAAVIAGQAALKRVTNAALVGQALAVLSVICLGVIIAAKELYG